MKKIIFAVLTLLPSLVFANAGAVHLDKANYDLSDKASLQRGAATFMNYCAGCHSTQYQRYNRVAADLEIPEELMKENLIFTGAKVGDLMKSAMSEKDAAKWFGAPPPDLTLVARVRGADWIYTYLRTYYQDDSTPTGWNNLVYPNVGMPHALWQLQGIRTAKFEERKDPKDPSRMEKVFVGYEQVTPGTMKPQEYDDNMADLVAFMSWMAEPAQLQRKRLGVVVLIFLAIFTLLAWRLNKAYWKDIH